MHRRGFPGLGQFMTKRVNRWDRGLLARLPDAYKKFWWEWKHQPQTPVHWIAEPGKWTRNHTTGEVKQVQNIPLPVIYPDEHNKGLWGGEGIVKGFQKRHPLRRRVPYFWVPVLKRSAVYSEILNKYFSVVITQRTLQLIHENYGFDNYVLKTPACDLKSEMALKIKQKLLMALHKKDIYPDHLKKQNEIYDKYKEYLIPEEEIEWYGLTLKEACMKQTKIEQEQNKIQPLKLQYRLDLIQKLKEAGLEDSNTTSSLLLKLNPFASKKENREL